MSTRTLVVCYPEWQVVAAGCSMNEPAVVVAANQVVAVSTAARAEGVESGLRRREAQGRCPDLKVVAADACRDARMWEAAAMAVGELCPRVEVTRPGMVAMGTHGPSRYFGGDEVLAAKVMAAVDRAVGTEGCQVGVADGHFAAELAARSACGQGRVKVVPAGGSARWLAPLPITALGRPELAGLLVRLGIRTLGDLGALPAESVLARFGPEGALAHRLARGLDDQPLTLRAPPPDLVVSTELDPPADRVDTAAFVGKALADELHRRLSRLGLACTRVAIEAETEHGEQLSRLWRHDGALRPADIAQRVRWQLDGWLSSAGGSRLGGLTLIRLVPDQLHPDHGQQLGFWGGSAGAEARVARSLARVQGLLGPQAVFTGVLDGGRDPDQEVRLLAWGEPGRLQRPSGEPGRLQRPPAEPGRLQRPPAEPGTARRGSAEIPPWPGQLPAPAPAVVHPTPLRAEVCDQDLAVVEVSGRGVVSSSPSTVSIEGGPAASVVAWAGPWPVDERWWDDKPRRRARFQVVTDTGAAYLFTRASGRWWVEATYD